MQLRPMLGSGWPPLPPPRGGASTDTRPRRPAVTIAIGSADGAGRFRRGQHRVLEIPWPTPPPRTLAGAPDDLLLKVTPPRVPRHQLARPRLQSDHERLRDHPVILVQAPAGFGKTSLLAQWRREHLAQGRVVAWLSAQPQDDVPRFVQGLALAVRTGCRPPDLRPHAAGGRHADRPRRRDRLARRGGAIGPGHRADRRRGRPPARGARATRWPTCCATRRQPARRGRGARRLPARDRRPRHLRHGDASSARPQLRFRLDETIELVRGRFGTRVDRDAAARLHELAEGWPLGPAARAVGDGRRQRPADGDLGAGDAGRRCRALSRPVRQPAAGQSGPGRRRVPDPHLHPRPAAPRAVPNRRAGRRTPASAWHGWRATRRSSPPARRATGCACTRWRATSCAAASRCCRPTSRRRCTRAPPTGWRRRG